MLLAGRARSAWLWSVGHGASEYTSAMDDMDRQLDGSGASALIAVCVGNTSTQVAVFADALRSGEPRSVLSCSAGDHAEAVRLIAAADAELEADAPDQLRLIAMASVNPEASRSIGTQLRAKLATRVVMVPEDVPVPMLVALSPDAKPGVDRLLAAAAAFDVLRQACVVVDAGTAMTVNFVDGEGTFQGGVIGPGLRMALKALHEHTAGLPELEFEKPADEWIGKDTRQAMLQGVYHGARGLVRLVVERYAEAYEGYPAVVACGGDAQVLFGEDEFVDRVVPDLVLRGIALAFRRAAAGSGHDEEDAGGSF